MNMQKVKSSNIHAIGYDADTRTLTIAFGRNATWSYADVPPDVHRALMAAESKGRYFAASIKGRFVGTRLMPAEPEPMNALAAG